MRGNEFFAPRLVFKKRGLGEEIDAGKREKEEEGIVSAEAEEENFFKRGRKWRQYFKGKHNFPRKAKVFSEVKGDREGGAIPFCKKKKCVWETKTLSFLSFFLLECKWKGKRKYACFWRVAAAAAAAAFADQRQLR